MAYLFEQPGKNKGMISGAGRMLRIAKALSASRPVSIRPSAEIGVTNPDLPGRTICELEDPRLYRHVLREVAVEA